MLLLLLLLLPDGHLGRDERLPEVAWLRMEVFFGLLGQLVLALVPLAVNLFFFVLILLVPEAFLLLLLLAVLLLELFVLVFAVE